MLFATVTNRSMVFLKKKEQFFFKYHNIFQMTQHLTIIEHWVLLYVDSNFSLHFSSFFFLMITNILHKPFIDNNTINEIFLMISEYFRDLNTSLTKLKVFCSMHKQNRLFFSHWSEVIQEFCFFFPLEFHFWNKFSFF